MSNFKILSHPQQELKMGIKSSLSNIRRVFALSYLLYKNCEDIDCCEYSEEYDLPGKKAIKLKELFKHRIDVFIGGDVNYNDNPLFTSQIESLYVGLTLVFRIAKIRFKNGSSFSAERTGGNRFDKVLSFTSNMFYIDLLLSCQDIEDQKSILKSWLKNEPSRFSFVETQFKLMLSFFMKDTIFKKREDGQESYFQTECLYNNALLGSFSFEDSHELVGPTRILKSYLSEELDPCLSITRGIISNNSNSDSDYSLDKVYKLIKNSLDVSNTEPFNQEESSSLTNNNTPSESFDIEPLELSPIMKNFITALRTKPFLLLAGISGTGKSRKVKELAYMTCKKGSALAADPTSPGNYCLIEVKPNWHDSTELLGYYSNLSGKYSITPFIHFAYKAIQNPDVPFFVCLDEMNLAPVEQYFAEYLSVLETRRVFNGKIESSELLKKEDFNKCEIEKDGDKIYSGDELDIINYLKVNGLRLPENLFVIGTVNMDDTTHQFSRKVIDRAFTIEMNGDDLRGMFDAEDTLVYPENELKLSDLKPEFVQAADALADPQISLYANLIKETVPARLDSINTILNNTPFKVSYRVQNELVLYISTLISDNHPSSEEQVKSIIDQATLIVLLEKILPRVQGDENMLGDALKDLKQLVENEYSNLSKEDVYKEVVSKLDQMQNRLTKSYFANFF